MKKTDSKPSNETPEQELKRLRKENAKLKSQKESDKVKIETLRKELKKRRAEASVQQRTMEAHFEPVKGHRYSIQIILLCVFIYVKTTCGLRTVVEIMNIFEDVLGGPCGKAPSYTTVRNWMLKLRLSVYEEDKTPEQPYAMVMDESITVNRQKLLLTPAFHRSIRADHWNTRILRCLT